MALGVRKEEEEIIKPRNDKREYRRIVLQNNLHVLLISDADTDKCAASMDVRVGSFSDPEGLEGCGLDVYDATTREIKAVDSENQKNLLSDLWRMNQLQKHLSVKNHPYHKFSTGNWETLEIRPKERGVDTRQELLRFYKDYYSANLMHLMASINVKAWYRANFRISEIQIEVVSVFLANLVIKKVFSKSSSNYARTQGEICMANTLGIHHYKEGPTRYLSHSIGHEGEGSLFYFLKKLGWATSLTAGESDWTCEISFFKVNVNLTDAGYEHFEDIVALLFKYIRLLQQAGPCQWIFDELAAICETSFHYQDKFRPIDYVVNATFNMQFYPPTDWLVGSSLPSKFNPERIQSALKELSPYNNILRVNKQWIERAPAEDLHLPVPNVFIPTDLSLKNVSEQMKLPVLLRKTQYSRLWYKPDTAFSSPNAYLKIDFNCPFTGSSHEAVVLTEIFTRLLMDYLNEYAYDAQVAGLYYGVSSADYGFQVTVVGYNHKLAILLETVIQRLANFEVKPDRFAVIKESIAKEYQNMKFQQPYQQAMYYCSLILQDETWPWSEELEVLPHLGAQDLVKFYPLMFSRIFVECLAAGNLLPTEAETIIQHIEDVFFKGSDPRSQPLFASQYMTNRIVKLEKGIHYFYSTEGLNPSDENSALVHYIQVHQDDFKLNVTLQLFAVIAKQPAFHQLRSVEQLGYITVLMQRNDAGVRGVKVIIQSTVKGPGQIDLRVESFLKMFETKLYEMSSD
ncbi:hypothetical protein ACS0TY_025654 [Phlomoides rotata]